MNFRIKDTKRAIYQVSNIYPKDTLITNYRDFLGVRDYLHYYRFNLSVFKSLIRLTNEIWQTTNRISRLSLVNTLKRYYNVSAKKSINAEVAQLLFILFQKSTIQIEYISKKQLPEIQRMSNFLLKDHIIDEQAALWLCNHVDKSPHVINRMLRYPSKSAAISKWVYENFEKDQWRSRRAELVGWILNEDPSYIVPDHILIADFEYMNEFDKKVLRDYEEFQEFNDQIDHEFEHLLDGRDSAVEIPPNLKFSTRFYDIPLDMKYSRMMMSVPDFNSLERDFFTGLNNIKSVTMQWGVFYSKLHLNKKVELIKGYYSIETFWTTLKLGKKLESLPLLDWLLKRLKKQ